MSTNITFSDTRLAGTTHSTIPDLIYLDLEITGGGSISGYVPTHVAKLVKAAPELLEACQAMVEWFRKEKAGWRKDRSTPEGEAAWREWWEEQLALCDRSETLANAAVEKATA